MSVAVELATAGAARSVSVIVSAERTAIDEEVEVLSKLDTVRLHVAQFEWC